MANLAIYLFDLIFKTIILVNKISTYNKLIMRFEIKYKQK